MSYLLLWIELLAACLTFATLVMAFAMRRDERWKLKLLVLIALLLPAGPLILLPGLAVAIIPAMRRNGGVISKLLVFVGALVPASGLIGLSVVTGSLAFYWRVHSEGFWWALALFGAYCAGVVLILLRARRLEAEGPRAGELWSIRRILLGLSFTCLILFMTLWNLNLQAQVEVQGLRAKAGAIANSVAPPLVPESLDAAPLYAQVQALSDTAALPEDKTRDYQQMEATSPELASYLARQEKALAVARRAADMPGCNDASASTDLDLSINRILPLLGTFRSTSNLLEAAARSEAAAGQTDLALDDCRRMYAVGAHAGSSSMLISGLVLIAIDVRSSHAAAEILPQVKSRQQLDHLPSLAPDAVGQAYARCLRMESAYSLATICDFAAGDGPPFHNTTIGSLSWQLWLKEDAAIYRGHLEEAQEMARQPYFKVAAARAALDDPQNPRNRRGVFSTILIPSLQSATQHVTEAEALRLAVNEARAATLYRLDHGSYPDTADALVPAYLAALPTDPFDGKPMRYKKLPDGSLTIYSLGKDTKDDGGDIEKKERKAPPDVGITLRLPASATKP